MRFTPHWLPALKAEWEWQDHVTFDNYVARNLPECDLFSGLSGSGLKTGALAKRRGAIYVCDRGSSHIRFQNQLLREEFELQGIRHRGIDPRVVDREEEEYALADAIVLPSQFAYRSFLQMGVAAEKLKLAPYGVELGAFHKTCDPEPSDFNVLFVGALSVRKGIGYLLKAFDQLSHPRKRMILAGSSTADSKRLLASVADRADTSILGHVPHPELKDLMSRSHVLVLPSLEEGLSMVQAQAMACGCPVIATTNTGASDLFTDGCEGFIVPIRNAAAIAEKLQLLADNRELSQQMRQAALQRVTVIGGWDHYGATMNEFFHNLCAGRRGAASGPFPANG
jgi:glycosyltransferase involved in cell wall biosynthesis